MNARMDTLQAAIVGAKFEWYNETLEKRRECAMYYTSKLKNNKSIILPTVMLERTSVWAQYSILAKNNKDRDDIVKYLKDNGVNAAIFYPVPLHYQECFAEYLKDNKNLDLSVTEDICSRVFNLPCYGELKLCEQDKIIKIIKDGIELINNLKLI